jgi:hypothetical protein
MDPAFYDAATRRDRVLEWGSDGAILFPQWGLGWESLFFADNILALQANAAAWNRYAADVRAEGHGHLYPVGHLTLQGDRRWLFEQLRNLATADIHMAVVTPALINGSRPSRPEHDPIWEAFVENGVTLTHHISSGHPYMFDRAWVDNDTPTVPAVGIGMFPSHTHLFLGDLTINGVFQRHPDLRVALIEEAALLWVERFAASIDRGYLASERSLGRSINRSLECMPSEYLFRHCRFGVLASEQGQSPTIVGAGQRADGLVNVADRIGDVFCWGGDWPHAEGERDPLNDFREKLSGNAGGGACIAGLWRENARWILHQV